MIRLESSIQMYFNFDLNYRVWATTGNSIMGIRRIHELILLVVLVLAIILKLLPHDGVYRQSLVCGDLFSKAFCQPHHLHRSCPRCIPVIRLFLALIHY